MSSTVLLVEDSPDLRRMFARCLVIHGFAVIQAVDGRDALEALDRLTPDLILTDLMMPQMDGLELIRRVRSIPRLADIPIVVMTAIGTFDVGIEAREAGASECLRKPVDVTTIADHLGELCQGTHEQAVATVERLGRA